MAEAAITLPVVLLAAFAMINMALAGFASVNAANAANYGARAGSVSQVNPAGAAYSAVEQAISNARIGEYQVAASGGGAPGAEITVAVSWSVPNYFSGLAAFFGAGGGSDFSGTVRSSFRQEGW
jgi:hypothetical protein